MDWLKNTSNALLQSSRISPTDNGAGATALPVCIDTDAGQIPCETIPNVLTTKSSTSNPVDYSSGQKWWAAILLGIIFLILSSRVAYMVSSTISESLGGMPLADGGPSIPGLLLHTVIFIVFVRIILW